jgi:hypothetical protein
VEGYVNVLDPLSCFLLLSLKHTVYHMSVIHICQALRQKLEKDKRKTDKLGERSA